MIHRRRTGAGHPPSFSEAQILAWADAFHARTGRWPNSHSGVIPYSGGDNWRRVDSALRLGLRGCTGKSSLALFLVAKRGIRTLANIPQLRVPEILAWADAFHRRTGQWPKETSGPIPESPGDTWFAIDRALRAGVRGLPRGSSLPRLLAKQRGVRNHKDLPTISVDDVLKWADQHFKRFGQWPGGRMGEIGNCRLPGTTWRAVNIALYRGGRGLPGGSSLARVLDAFRRHTNGRGRSQGTGARGQKSEGRGRKSRASARRS
jgi:hypothetical protein